MILTMSHVFITRAIPKNGINLLRSAGHTVDVYAEDRILTQSELIEIMKAHRYDAIICMLTDTIDRAFFDAVPSVKIVASYTTGYDNIDVETATEKGVVITNAPALASADAVAQHTIALIFALSKRIVEADQFVKMGGFKGWAPVQFIGSDLSTQTLGLVGIGQIGERVAQLAYAVGLRIMYTDLHPNRVVEEKYHGVKTSSLDEVLKEADIISLHVPLLSSTHHLINADKIALMKPTSYIINTSRGAVIDETALVDALKKRTIAGAALDVFEHEPILAEGLCELSNVILTPHIASASKTAREQMSEISAQCIVDFFNTKTPAHVIHA